MKRVILTVGPQYAGKSTFCERVVSAHPEIVLVSRDAILTELFGTVWLDHYTGGHVVGWEKMWEIVAQRLQQDGVTMILDAWNGSACERRDFVKRLRSLGAERVEAWYFITPENFCLQWYLKGEPPDVKARNSKWRQLIYQMRIDSYHNHYQYFHLQKVELEQGFDFIRRIDPLQTLPPDLFSL